eukprot:1395234-Amorphochlora_amoeboformis.AAC.3
MGYLRHCCGACPVKSIGARLRLFSMSQSTSALRFYLSGEPLRPAIDYVPVSRTGILRFSTSPLNTPRPYGPMDKAPAYGAGDSGFESR